MRISDWSSDVCSSDLGMACGVHLQNVDMPPLANGHAGFAEAAGIDGGTALPVRADAVQRLGDEAGGGGLPHAAHAGHQEGMGQATPADRSEEHTSELQSLMRISYAVFCLNKNTNTKEEQE